jgi:hypothetical protein
VKLEVFASLLPQLRNRDIVVTDGAAEEKHSVAKHWVLLRNLLRVEGKKLCPALMGR